MEDARAILAGCAVHDHRRATRTSDPFEGNDERSGPELQD